MLIGTFSQWLCRDCVDQFQLACYEKLAPRVIASPHGSPSGSPVAAPRSSVLARRSPSPHEYPGGGSPRNKQTDHRLLGGVLIARAIPEPMSMSAFQQRKRFAMKSIVQRHR